MNQPWTIAWNIIKDTGLQFVVLFGIFVIGGLVLTLLSRWTNNVFKQFLFPNFGMYLFGVIGVPVHELSHAFFCKLFFHDVREIKWFDAKGANGAHGSVSHEYNPWNLYHRIGHFFIGLGPVILAPMILAALFYFLVPSGKALWSANLLSAQANAAGVADSFFSIVFSKTSLMSWGFWLFLYLAACICSQMELSREDLKQVRTGVIPILICLILINLTAFAFGASWHARILEIGLVIAMTKACVYVFAACLSSINLLACTLIMSLVNRLCGRELVNPFR